MYLYYTSKINIIHSFNVSGILTIENNIYILGDFHITY